MARGRKGKYNEEVVEKIAQAIATDGGHEAGWKAGGISHDTFYKWIKEKADFAEAVASAQYQFQQNCPTYIKGLAIQSLLNYLQEGAVVEWTTEENEILEHYVPGKNGEPDQLKWYQKRTTHKKNIDKRPAPQWAIERVLGKPIQDIDQAIAFLESKGFKVIADDTEIIRRWLAAQPGGSSTIPEGTQQDPQELSRTSEQWS